jgi:hypothetical protein
MWRRVDLVWIDVSEERIEKSAREEPAWAGGCSSEALIHRRSTRRHIPEDGILHSHRRENLKSHLSWVLKKEELILNFKTMSSLNVLKILQIFSSEFLLAKQIICDSI